MPSGGEVSCSCYCNLCSIVFLLHTHSSPLLSGFFFFFVFVLCLVVLSLSLQSLRVGNVRGWMGGGVGGSIFFFVLCCVTLPCNQTPSLSWDSYIRFTNMKVFTQLLHLIGRSSCIMDTGSDPRLIPRPGYTGLLWHGTGPNALQQYDLSC